MNQNYHLLCLEEIKKLDKPKKILLHSCCAPCSSYVITFLSNYFDITVLYYNPNISPYEEYEKRKKEQIKLIKNLKTKNKLDFLDCDYDNELYNKVVTGFEEAPEGGSRCHICFNLRLEKTAILAKENNYEYFSSTLTVSPHKNSKVINEIGFNLSKKYNIKWLYSDFKKNEGFKQSIELSKKYNLYRQNYCGCIYSKKRLEKQEITN
ncbi:MAG: epoxyqueuosine reductase QueH [Bacilli bacterium]|nr:epoxyqueuosine reductase QueH [Bacilli bacterium]